MERGLGYRAGVPTRRWTGYLIWDDSLLGRKCVPKQFDEATRTPRVERGPGVVDINRVLEITEAMHTYELHQSCQRDPLPFTSFSVSCKSAIGGDRCPLDVNVF